MSPAAPSAAAAVHQQLRWEGGRRHVVRTWVPRLLARAVRERRPALLDVAGDLLVPPLGVLTGLAFAGLALGAALTAAGALPAAALVPWAVAAAAIPAFVLIGLKAADAPASGYRALAGAPRLVVGKLLGLGASGASAPTAGCGPSARHEHREPLEPQRRLTRISMTSRSTCAPRPRRAARPPRDEPAIAARGEPADVLDLGGRREVQRPGQDGEHDRRGAQRGDGARGVGERRGSPCGGRRERGQAARRTSPSSRTPRPISTARRRRSRSR